jgi:hypothetical protein
MFVEVNMDFVRGVSSWAAITKLGKDYPALNGVNVRYVGDGATEWVVTDRYRIVYALHNSGLVSDLGDDTSVTIPMDLFTNFAAGNKAIEGGVTVTISFDTDSSEVSFETYAGKVTGSLIRGQYPRVGQLVREWRAADTLVNDISLDMRRLADIVKFANPNSKFTTPAKQPSVWRMVRGVSSEGKRDGAVRFDLGQPELFCVLFQPSAVK